MSLQASRAPRNALAALERKYEGVEQRTGGNGSRRLSMPPPPPPPSASAAALVGGPSPAPLDEAAVDGMMAVVAVWLAERAMELEPAAEGAVRRLVAMPKYASEDDVEALLYGACARHEERLESVSRRDSASRAEVEQLARTLCAEDFPLWRLDGHSAERPPLCFLRQRIFLLPSFCTVWLSLATRWLLSER